MTCVTLINLASQVLGLISLVVLYLASFGVPYDGETWKGISQKELSTRYRQKWLGCLGITCGVSAILLQMMLTIL